MDIRKRVTNLFLYPALLQLPCSVLFFVFCLVLGGGFFRLFLSLYPELRSFSTLLLLLLEFATSRVHSEKISHLCKTIPKACVGSFTKYCYINKTQNTANVSCSQPLLRVETVHECRMLQKRRDLLRIDCPVNNPSELLQETQPNLGRKMSRYCG